MCGIVSMISTVGSGFFAGDLEIFEQMLYVDALRGPDSTGAFCVQRNQQVQGFKHATCPSNTFTTQGWQNFRREAIQDGRVMVGHNRKATHGSINNANSHPFYEGHIVLVHNGTLWNHKNKLADREVDSHAFAAKLSETDIDKVPELVSEVDGAYAFVWWDMEQKKLFFVRNKERPLNLIQYDHRIILASEMWMAMGIVQRNVKNLSYNEKDERRLRYSQIPENILHSVDLSGKIETVPIPEKKITHSPVVLTTTQTGPTQKTSTETGGAVVPFSPRNNLHKAQQGVFKPGANVVVKLERAQDIGQGMSRRIRAMGKVQMIGKPAWDIVGYLPEAVDPADIQDWLNGHAIGKIVQVAAHLAAGPSLTLGLLSKQTAGTQEKSWNGLYFYEPEWEYIEEHCKCKMCSHRVHGWDREFTNVKVDKFQNIEVICADCVEERIENNEVKTEFVERRIAALDGWQPSSSQSAIGTNEPTRVEGPTTLQ